MGSVAEHNVPSFQSWFHESDRASHTGHRTLDLKRGTGYGSPIVISIVGGRPDVIAVEESPDDIAVREKLVVIKAAFELQTVRMAELLGVSRQTIYLWEEGQGLSKDNEDKLEALYLAAKRFKEAGLEANYQTKHRLIDSELEFIEGLGQDPLAAVETLIEVIERGKQKRAWLEQRLADRPKAEGSILDEFPPHYPGE